MKHCSRCVHVGETLCDPDIGWDDYGLYECTWDVVTPLTWQWCRRERIDARGEFAETCPCFEEKP
jgi:hypothetical protein